MISLRFFKGILSPVMMRVKKDFIAENFKKITKFFKESFNLAYLY